MTFQHKSLADGRWQTFSFVEQMANVGSEVERALNWKQRGHETNWRLAYERALELMYLTIDDPRNLSRVRELTRVYESLVDYFDGENTFGSSDLLMRHYFGPFAFAARRDR